MESLLGGVRDAAPGEDPQDIVNEAGKQEIPLTLNNRFEGVAGDDDASMKTLFVRYCILGGGASCRDCGGMGGYFMIVRGWGDIS